MSRRKSAILLYKRVVGQPIVEEDGLPASPCVTSFCSFVRDNRVEPILPDKCGLNPDVLLGVADVASITPGWELLFRLQSLVLDSLQLWRRCTYVPLGRIPFPGQGLVHTPQVSPGSTFNY